MIICKHLGCTAAIKNNKWSRIKAQEIGWFGESDGSYWCPGHVPSWVRPWRYKK